MRRFNKVTSGVLIAASLLLGTPHAAEAIAKDGFSIYPNHPLDPITDTQVAAFRYKLGPNATANDSLIVHNGTAQSVSLRLYPVDAKTNSSGAVTLNSAREVRRDIGSWIALDQSEVTLAPGQSQVITFHLSIPPQVAVGDHIGGIIAELAPRPADQTGNNVRLDIIERFGLRVSDHVPGQVHSSLQVSSFRLIPQRHLMVSLALKNEGNTVVTTAAAITLSGLNGRSKRIIPVPRVELPPKQATRVMLPANQVLILFAHPTANLRLSYDGGVIIASTSLWWIEWTWLLIIFDIVLLSIVLVFIVRARRGIS